MRRFLLIPAYFGVLLLALFGSPAIANHNADLHENMRHVANRTENEDDRTFTDLAFWGRTMVQGTYDGFRVFDISNPGSPKEVADFPCNGGQGDVSLHKAGNRLLLFRSIDSPQDRPECAGSTGVATAAQPTTPTLFEGIRIIDVTNPAKPKFVTGVYTDCGSHTHTLIRDNRNNRAIIYVSSYPIGAQYDFDVAEEFGPSKQCKIPHARISIIVVPNSAPQNARVHHEHPIHPAATEGQVGEAVPGTIGCHDITVFTDPKVKDAAAACLTEGQLWDISNPLYPCTMDAETPQAPRNQGADCHTHINVENVELYHSSTYTWDARVVLFGDEHGGGLAPGCNGEGDPQGNIWFHKNVQPGTPTAPVLGRYIIPRVVNPQPCTMHNFNIIPIENNRRYIGVSSAYQGGTTVFDFTGLKQLLANPPIQANPPVCCAATEIAFWDSENGDKKGRADDWSTYWHNNFIYASSGLGSLRDAPIHRVGNRGLDVWTLLVNGRRFTADTEPYQNPQTQEDLEENEGREGEND